MPIPGVDTAIKLPAGPAKFLMAKLLTPAEYAFVAKSGLQGAHELVKRFADDGTHHISSLHRASVV